MFIGHFGVGFGAKRAAPRTSLGTLFLGAQFVDLLWPSLLLLGVEQVRIQPGITRVTPLDFVSYPITHSLAIVIVWGVAVGAIYWTVRRYLAGAIVVGAAVVSHWVLDLLVHRPDLPLVPGGPKVGLGLWNSLPGTLVLECAIFVVGLAIYLRCTRATDRIGKYGLLVLVLFLAVVYVGNITGPPPPSVEAIAWLGQAQWVIVILAYWIDAHRRTNC